VAGDEEFEVALKSEGKKKISISRIATLTGLNRKEVGRLMDADSAEPELSSTNRSIRVISGWT